MELRRIIRLLIMGMVFLGVLGLTKYISQGKSIPKENLKEDILASCKELNKENVINLEIGMEKMVNDKLFVIYTFKNGDGWNYLGDNTYNVIEDGRLKREEVEINQFQDNNIDKMSETKAIGFKDDESYNVYYGTNPNGKTQKFTTQMTAKGKTWNISLEGKGKYFIEVFTSNPNYKSQ